MRNAPKKSAGSLNAHLPQHGRMKTLGGAKSDSRVADAEKFLLPTYQRQPFVLERGKGCYVFDAAGKKYLDFLGGIAVNALGHGHPRIVKVIRREAARAIHFSNLYHNAYQGPLARKLAEWSGLERVFFCNSGTEAIDGAMKLARLCARTPQDATGQPARKHRFLALENSFHGRTYGAISVTATEKYRLPFAPVVPGVEFLRFNDVADLEAKFNDSVCGILIETVQGEGGIYPVSESFWNRARALATEHGALMIADEIQCGLGRTGRYFAYQRLTSKPDIAVIAKPLAAGLPLGAILATDKVASYISPGLHGTTFGGGPLVCAVALECLQIIEDEKLLENVRSRGEELNTGLQALAAKFDFIREVRAEGLMVGVHLSMEGAPFVAEAAKRGLLVNCTHDHILRLLPPFIVTRAQIREFLKLFSVVLAAVSEKPAAAENTGPVTKPSNKYATAR
ncbi:MAG TPA: aspartate aminotransferase family protein [Candidatus Acidoferrum sp.]|jgi:acetylornithine aminotransferase/acetylornithine/N-succinyldiaminopimelate aminotransferase|nr:aspartate aminotransferase family protein [Candidatus Acidoferrum sp.]